MSLLISLLKKSILIFFIFFIQDAYAEYYYYPEYNGPFPSIVYIDCKGHHCNWRTHHASNWHYDTRHHRNRNIGRCCNQDLATGDDNPCRHPDLQINY